MEPWKLADQFRNLTEQQRKDFLLTLSETDRLALLYNWDFQARPNQRIPEGEWVNWFVCAGRGFGKTRVGAETVRRWARENPGAYINVIAPTSADIRDVCVEGESGILAVCPPDERPDYSPSKRILEWPNGAKSLLFSAEEPERLRGPQSHKMWMDELAAWQQQEQTWNNAMFGLRLGIPQVVITTTPRPTALVRKIQKDPNTVVTRGTTMENSQNLAPLFLAQIISKYQGTRLGRQEINAELLEDNPGALFHLDQILLDRWTIVLPTMARIVIAIDPAVSANPDSDETGIVIAGMDNQPTPHFYILGDLSDIETPDGWARKAVRAYRDMKADRIIGEANNGGDMIESTIRHVDPNVSYRKVHATRGKAIRAEPISALYEQHRVHHVGDLKTLEDEMCAFDPGEYMLGKISSPNRMDALVWALWELSEGNSSYGVLDLGASGAGQRILNQLGGKPIPNYPMPTVLASTGEMVKATNATTLGKVMTNDKTPECPKCQSTLIQNVSGQKRCCQCGTQWGDVKTTKAMTRKEALMTLGQKRTIKLE